IGTGWGGFAMHAAGRYGCRVTTTTISREQHAYATRRVREEGLQDRVTVLLQDYRELSGSYDKLVSIEMIEAVGWQYFPTFFRRCSELLAPDGAMLLQAITIDDRAYEVEKAGKSFINTHIFPGGCLPSMEVISRSVARVTDLRQVHLEDITAHYATTLERWRERFLAAGECLSDLGDEGRYGEWERDGIVPREVFARAGQGGFLAMAAPEEHGGAGAEDFRFNLVIGEECQRAAVGGFGLGITLHNDISLPYFMSYCKPAQRERWLGGIVSGELITAIAMTEPGIGSDLAGMSTSARR